MRHEDRTAALVKDIAPFADHEATMPYVCLLGTSHPGSLILLRDYEVSCTSPHAVCMKSQRAAGTANCYQRAPKDPNTFHLSQK